MLRSADDAMLSPFYNTLADELGGDEGAKALRVKDYLKRDYMKTRLAEQFELTQGQMDGILQRRAHRRRGGAPSRAAPAEPSP